MVPSSSRKAFTLIELLVVIAIIAILAVVVVLTLNPAELLRQSRDSNRLSDLSTINNAINLYNTDQSMAATYSLGAPSTTAISIADPSATSTAGDQCQGLGMPALPSGYTYDCAASSTYRAITNTGWIPINFASTTSGSPLGTLPVDPVNQTSSDLYYTYATNGSKYIISSFLESQKYAKAGETDGSYDPVLAEVGSGMSTLPSLGRGLAGYWPLNEGQNTTAVDWSGGGNNGTWSGTPSGTSGYYSPGHMWSWGGVFDGVTDGITAGGASTYVMGTNNFSFGAWIYPTGWPSSGVVLATGADSGTTAQGFTLRINTANQAVFMICDGTIRLSLPVTGLPTSTWSFVFATVNRSTNIGTVYLNGTAVATQSLVGLSSIGQAHVLQIGPSYVGGINDERVYNRALSITEIQALYNAEK